MLPLFLFCKKDIFLCYRRLALLQVQARSAPHFLFLWHVKEKENAPLAVEKKKKSFWQLVDGSVKEQTAALAKLHSACRFVLLLFPLPLVQSFSIITMGAAAEIGAGQVVTQSAPAKAEYAVSGTGCRYAPTRFLFLLYRQRHVFFFFARERKRRCGVESVGTCESAIPSVSKKMGG